ncbi:MAG TPA: RsmD family RNA methyltransferase, partial [Bacteroidia bacterium]|nr:RsmD family RNA methyltransferase [Bacteroidia bacterium]
NISFELASRGCPSVFAVDADYRCAKFISDAAQKYDLPAIRVMRSDVYIFLRKAKGQWDLIFADPPYEQQETADLPGLIFKKDMLAPDGLLVIEHTQRLQFTDTSRRKEQRTYGKVNFSIFG